MPKVTIIGDGAAWIRKGVEYIPNSRFVLDLFRLHKYIRKLCGNCNTTPVYELIKQDNKAEFTSYAQQQLKEEPERKQSIKKAITYIRNQWDAVGAILIERNIHSSTEAHVSHILSARLSSRPMGWSRKGAESVARLRVLHDNGESITDYVKGWLAKSHFSKTRILEVNNIASSKRLKAKLETYNTYLPLLSAPMPGVENKRNNWLKTYREGRFQKLM